MGRALRILVVDDEEAIRRIATLGLRRAGYDVLAMEDPMQALAELADAGDGVDLVVLDLSMPAMRGPEVYRRIRACWGGPVLFHSGYRSEDCLTHELEDPNTAFLPKPWTLTELVDAVAAILEACADR